MQSENIQGGVTQLLHDWQAGNADASSKLMASLLPELRRIAGRIFRRERPGHTLQPTALVNEAVLRLMKGRSIDWQDRRHFLAVAATTMRRLLVDHARARPKVAVVCLDVIPDDLLGSESSSDFIVELDSLLDQMEREFPRRRLLIELKFFVGLTDVEAADALGLKLHTLQREWFRSRKWLFERMNPTTTA